MGERKTVTVVFDELEPGVWRASLLGASHIGGTGKTPEEALGWLCFNHPRRMGIGDFRWKCSRPNPGPPMVETYPEGEQEPFGD